MVSIVAKLILDVHHDQYSRGHADRESGDVDEGIGRVPEQVARGYKEVVSDHLGIKLYGVFFVTMHSS